MNNLIMMVPPSLEKTSAQILFNLLMIKRLPTAKKKEQVVRGFSVNVTETCKENQLNFITDIDLKPAKTGDPDFFIDAIERSEDVVGKTSEASVDGAYHSKENDEFGEIEQIDIHYSGIQGAKGRYSYHIVNGKIEVEDTQTGIRHAAIEYKPGKFKFPKQEKGWNYFKQAAVDSFNLRQQVENLSPQIAKRRNNVEASIFQTCFFTRNNKTRYRGQFKNQMWARCRSMWINLIRIGTFMSNQGLTTT